MILVVELAHRARKLWWRIRRPQTLGVKVLVRDEGGGVLLVKPTYDPLWSFPGGGVRHREHPAVAAAREVREETGVRLDATDLSLGGVYVSQREGKHDTILFDEGNLPMVSPIPDGREIADARVFAIDALPADTAPSVHRRLDSTQHSRDW